MLVNLAPFAPRLVTSPSIPDHVVGNNVIRYRGAGHQSSSHHQIRRTDTLNQASDGKVYKSLRPPIDYGLPSFDKKERKYPRHTYKQTRAVRITERSTEY